VLFAIRLTLSIGIGFGWLSGSSWNFWFVDRWCVNKTPPCGVDKDTPCKGWYVLGDGVVIDVLLHLTEKLGSQFHCGGYHLGLEFVVTDFNFVGVD
jgi:hypothetical protein